MPEMLPVVALLPAAPAAPAPVVDAVQPAAPAGDRTNFLSQLKTALATLAKSAVPASQNSVVPILAADQAPQAPVDETTATKESSDKPADATSDVLPDLLAELGLVMVPLQTPPALGVKDTTPKMTAGAGDQPKAQSVAAAGVAAGMPVAGAQAPMDARAVEPTPAADRQTSHEVPRAEVAKAHAAVENSEPPVQAPSAETVEAPAIEQLDLKPITSEPHARATVPHKATASQTPGGAHAPHPAAVVSPQQAAPQAGFADTGTMSGDSEARQESTTAPSPMGPLSEGIHHEGSAPATSPVTATSGPVAASAAPPPAHVRPSEVVNQIAHQADLYRLPGNRGVRIQLHPEDLGGVDVTLRYSGSGGIQLHINVEHAATGALVQAGWTELRDALVTHGINPDRLVMTISAPVDARGMDLSNGNGSRPDQGLTSLMQEQSGQRGQDTAEDQTGPHGLRGTVESAAPENESSRTAATTATSRIDYRV